MRVELSTKGLCAVLTEEGHQSLLVADEALDVDDLALDLLLLKG